MTNWRKSSRCGANGTCIEVADLGGARGIRDSKMGNGSPVLRIAPHNLRAVLETVKNS